MKTEYSEEIIELIKNTFTPATPEDSSAQKQTLSELYMSITNVLPLNWVYEEDVYVALKDLGFKTFPVTEEDPFTKKQRTQFYYYLILKFTPSIL